EGSVILHAKMDALENAGRLTENIYSKCTPYTTLSPCVMCSGAILLYNIPQVIVGENKNFKDEEELLRSRGVSVTVLQDHDCIKIMSGYIKANPKLWQEDIGIG
ncbi:MAG: nucleoside deaminase, partial [Methanobacterium sp.]|nr:nucleoside deaminase [Methanobacterium sp.]